MKLNFKNSPTIASEDMAVSKMGVAQGAGDMLASYLRDRIYKDKILACVRETITNSQDEHVKYGITKAVEVKIENINGQYVWSSRDYAKGLSEDSIRNIYGMYGGSDKRDNNNQVGGFGVGALSPFAVSDSFYITSYHEGFKTQYACILGAGDSGVSVGEIYKVSDPEPTTESGLEVSLDVSNKRYDFESTTQKFVTTFLPDSNIIFTNQYGAVNTPFKPLLSKVINGYTINKYDNDFDYYTSSVAIRMGGIVYRSNSNLKIQSCSSKIVVDVPIGKLTVPISREDIEDTPSNRKVLDEIQLALNELMDEDKAKIVTPKFGASVLTNNYNSNYEGEWFTYSFSNTFPDSWNLRKKLEFLHSGYNHNITNGKYTIYLIPNIKSYKSWISRLDKFIGQIFPNTQIIWMLKPSNDCVSSDTLDLSDVTFVDVKQLGLPKLPKQSGTAEYLVFLNGGKHGSYTAEDLDEYVTEKYFNDEGISDGWEKKITKTDLLNMRVIGLTNDYGSSNRFWICNSKKMYDQLIELGWFTPNSTEYTQRLAEIRAEEKIKENMQNAAYRVKVALFRMANPSLRTIKVIGKNPDKISKLNKVKDLILQENSTRARILNSMDSYNSKVTREDLRKILKMQ
jgi:hypothetical protein